MKHLLWLLLTLDGVVHAQTTITALPANSVPSNADLVVTQQQPSARDGDGTVKTTIAQIDSTTDTLSGKTISYTSNTLVLPLTVNLQQLGACGITDGTSIFNAAAATATSSGQALYIPGGCTINHSGTLTLTSLQLYGDGITSVLNATDPSASSPNLALLIGGTGVVVHGINFKTTNAATRQTAVQSSALASNSGVGALTNFSLDHNFFTSQFAATDIQLFNRGTFGDISFNTITVGPLSNPIILQASGGLGNPVMHVRVHNNDMSVGGIGDNCIELTYAVQFIDVDHNQLDGCGAAAIAVIGAQHVTLASNVINNATGRGIALLADGAFTLVDISGISVVGNTIRNSAHAGSGAIANIFANGDGSHIVSDATFVANVVESDSGANAVQIGSCDGCSAAAIQVNRVTLDANILVGDGVNSQRGIEFRGCNDCFALGNTITGFLNEGIRTLVGNSGAVKINNNHLSNLSLASSGGFAAINLSNSGFSAGEVKDNSYTAGANAVSFLITCTGAMVPVIAGNIGTTTTQSCASSGGGANPTASVGTTTVNGTSTSFMRSDAAPPIALNIAPTWTGQHTFTTVPVVSNNGSGIHYSLIGTTSAAIRWNESSSAANTSVWDQSATSTGLMRFRVFNDALSANSSWLTVTRAAATVASLEVGNTTDKPPVTFDGRIISTLETPASSSATCTAGTIVADTGFVYVCTATNTWARTALSAF